MKIKDIVKDGKVAHITHVVGDGISKATEIWYETEDGFKFPVPAHDMGEGIFKSTEKCMLLMRYIRKHLAFLEEAKQEANV